MDDDEDGAVDYPADPGCLLPSDRSETDPREPAACSNEIDDDNDGRIDFPNDLGCIAASWDSETDLCGQGVPVYEYLLGSVAAYGSTEGEMATNVVDPNAPGCGRSGKPENIFVYRNQFRSRLTISTDYPETMTNTSVYLRARCLSGESELACDDGSSNGSNRGALTSMQLSPVLLCYCGNVHCLPGPFKLTIEAERDAFQCNDEIDNDEDGRSTTPIRVAQDQRIK